jgi:hypothetical protein
MRLLFVGDTLSPLVRRVVEFLNRELKNVEVLAVEYSVWQDDTTTKVLVPTVYGSDAETTAAKGSGETGRVWTEQEWLETFEGANGGDALSVVRRLVDHRRAHGGTIEFGVGGDVGVTLYLDVGGCQVV